MNKLLNIGSWIVIFMAFIFLGVIIYWATYPYKIIEIKTPILPIKETVIKQGGTLTYYVNYCKYVDIPALVSRTLQDDIEYIIPSTMGTRSIGCRIAANDVVIPQSLPPSKYKLELKYTYKVNPIRTIEVESTTAAFMVIQ